MAKEILVVGSAALDSVETIHGRTVDAAGGAAIHFSMSASIFAPVRIIAVVGEDFPQEIWQLLHDHNVDTSEMITAPGKTFRWIGRYDKNFKSAETISTCLNVFEGFSPVLKEESRKCSSLFLANIDPDIQYNVLKQMEKPQITACDTMNYWINLKKASLKKLLKEVDILFINDEEARLLTGEHNIITAARHIMRDGPSAIVVKRGDAGSLLAFGDKLLPFPAWAVEKVADPTGAGDTFGGAFMGCITQADNWRDINELKKAMAYATVISSFNVEDFSVRRVSALQKEEIERRFKTYTDNLRV